jgi:hypothetical protein
VGWLPWRPGDGGRLSTVDVGDANGWNVWPLENGDWAWNVWIAAGQSRSGAEATESEAQKTAQRELELMISEARAAAARRTLAAHGDRDGRWGPRL